MPKKRKDETSYRETSLSIIPRSKLILLEIEGIKKAWDFVLETKKKRTIPLTPPFLQKIHRIGFGWIFPKMGGKLRKVEVTVSQHTPPKFYLVPQLIFDFTRDLNTRIKYLPSIEQELFLENLVNLLAWAHHRFLWIHPFQDYNGRIGRLLINLILLNLQLPPVELKIETRLGRAKYIEALKGADHGYYKKLEKLIESAVSEAIQEINL